ATLAREGYTGPETVLEGPFGFLTAFARDTDPPRLTRGLGEEWHTLKNLLKRYACHITAHVPVSAVLDAKREHGFSIDDVESVAIAADAKVVSHHNILEPQDIMMGQYSVPFFVALALKRDPLDPRSFDASALEDADIRRVCRSTRVSEIPKDQTRGRFSSLLTIRLKGGREIALEAHDYEGMPSRPLSKAALREKFMKL